MATTLDEDAAHALVRHWDDGWNGADVAVIMAPFADDVMFTSPFVSRYTGDPEKDRIEGYDSLEAYVTDALVRTPGIRYTANATYVSTDSLVLLYTVHRPDGTDVPGADTMRVNGDGKVVEWRSHYDYSFRP